MLMLEMMGAVVSGVGVGVGVGVTLGVGVGVAQYGGLFIFTIIVVLFPWLFAASKALAWIV